MAGTNLYDAYFPLLLASLDSLDAILAKAQEHAKENSIDPDAEYINAKLHDDMYPFVKQVQTSSMIVKALVTNITGLGPEQWVGDEKTFAELSVLVEKTRELAKQVKPEHLNAREEEVIEFKLPSGARKATVQHWIAAFGIPNVFFHVVTAYDILRMKGVPLGKMDYLKSFIAM